jgi:hypothetical protein
MVKTNDYAIWLFAVLLIFLVFGLFSDLGVFRERDVGTITGRATTANADTTANIANWFSINLSTNLSGSGIVFDIDTLPASDANATANYEGYNTTGTDITQTNETRFFLTVDIDSNVYVDFCIKANDSLRAGSNFIGLGNYTWANSTAPTNASFPPFTARKALINDTYDNATENIGRGNSSYYRFWLDVPGDQDAGTYVNQINFKGVQITNDC